MQEPLACHLCDKANSEHLESHLIQESIDRLEAERAKIAREIHDEAGQLLISAEFCLDFALSKLPPGLVARDWVEQARQSLDEARDELHRISSDLRPRILDDFGLIPALRSYLNQYAKLAGITVESELAEPPGKLAPSLELGLFRIAQETLVNARKHSQATSIHTHLSFEHDHLLLEISDNGIGFQPGEVANSADTKPKLGLLGLLERAVALGGDLEIISHPGEGTAIRAMLPIVYAGELDKGHGC